MGAATYGSKIYFAGGTTFLGASDKLEIYTPATDTWESSTLVAARAFPTVVGVGRKVLFAGGINFSTLDEHGYVDIYDTLTQTWTLGILSTHGFYGQAVSYQNTAMLAGFYQITSQAPLNLTFNNVVYFYNAISGNWSDTLSQARGDIAATVVGDVALFAGGLTGPTQPSDRVDLYNFTTGTWSTATLSVPRAFMAAVTVGNKAIFAGGTSAGNTQSNAVDIYDYETGEWSTAQLSFPRSFTTRGGAACNKAFFAGGGKIELPIHGFTSASNVVDIYDAGSGLWTTDTLTRSVINHVVTGLGDQVFVAGGVIFTPTGTQLSSLVETFTCQSSGVTPEPDKHHLDFSAFPDPCSEYVQIIAGDNESNIYTAEIFDLNGRLAKRQEIPGGQTAVVDIAELPNGVYVLKVYGTHQMGVKKMIKSGYK